MHVDDYHTLKHIPMSVMGTVKVREEPKKKKEKKHDKGKEREDEKGDHEKGEREGQGDKSLEILEQTIVLILEGLKLNILNDLRDPKFPIVKIVL